MALSPDGSVGARDAPVSRSRTWFCSRREPASRGPFRAPATCFSTGGRPSSLTGGGFFSGPAKRTATCVPTFRTSRVRLPRHPSAPDAGCTSYRPTAVRCSPKRRRGWRIYPADGKGRPRPVEVAEGNVSFIQWSADGKTIYAREDDRQRLILYRLDLATGRRERWKELASSRPNGLSVLRAGRGGARHEHHSRRPVLRLYVPDRLEPARPRRGGPGLVEVRRSRSAGRRDRLALDAPTPIEIDCRSSRSPRPQPGARGPSG